MKIPCLIAAGACLYASPILASSPVPPGAAQFAASRPATTLAAIVHPPIQIIDATVLDANGAMLGTVQRVEVTPAGVPTAVAVALAAQPGRVEVLDAGAVSYDPATNRIIAGPSSHG